jgi:transposase
VVGGRTAVADATAERAGGAKPLPDRPVLQGILFALFTGIDWEDLPQELGFGSGMTCWQQAGRATPINGTIGDCYDNSMMESFWATMQLEVLDTRTWESRDQLANAIFEWIECWYNPKRGHFSIECVARSPAVTGSRAVGRRPHLLK